MNLQLTFGAGGLSLKGSERENRGATGNEGWGYKWINIKIWLIDRFLLVTVHVQIAEW